MVLYNQPEAIALIGIHVATFPNGIKEAFESLMKTLGNGRSYYGISWLEENDTVTYFAMATSIFNDEGKLHNYEALSIAKGEYRTETVHDWVSNTACIKDVFHDLTGNTKPDKNHPCIEWYKSDEEMLCMVKT